VSIAGDKQPILMKESTCLTVNEAESIKNSNKARFAGFHTGLFQSFLAIGFAAEEFGADGKVEGMAIQEQDPRVTNRSIGGES